MGNNKKKIKFYVVKFKQLPFNGIGDFVCVPFKWVIRKPKDKLIAITYPSDEDPSTTRDRVKRMERCGYKWSCYIAEVQYESHTYQDAEQWITTKTVHDTLEKKVSKISRKEERTEKDTQPQYALKEKQNQIVGVPSSASTNDKAELKAKQNDNFGKLLPKLRIKRLYQQYHTTQPQEKRIKLDNEPGCSTNKQPAVNVDNDAVQCNQTVKTVRVSNDEKSMVQYPQPKPTEQNKQGLSMPLLDVDEPYQLLVIDEATIHKEHMQSNKIDDKDHKDAFRNPTAASVTEPTPSTVAERIPDSSQHHLLDGHNSSNESIKPNIITVRSTATADDNTELHTEDASNSRPTASHIPKSQILAAQITKAPVSITKVMPVENKCTVQYPSRESVIKTTNSTRLVEEQPSTFPAQYVRDIPSLSIATERTRNSNAIDRDAVLRNVAEVASAQYDLPPLPHQRPRISNDASKIPLTTRNNQNSQQQLPERYVGIHNQPQNNEQKSLQEVTNQTQQFSAINLSLTRKSTKQNHPMTSSTPANITASTSLDNHISDIPTSSQYLSSKIQPKSAHTHIPQHHGDQTQLLHESFPESIIMTEMSHLRDNLKYASKLIDSACQTDKAHASTSKFDSVNDHISISDDEMVIDEKPVFTEKYFTENPTSANRQKDSRIDLEQRLLDEFTTCITQMGSSLYNSCEMLKNLRNMILKCESTYNKILVTIEGFNTLENPSNKKSQACPSSNATPNALHIPKERPTKATAREISSNYSEPTNKVLYSVPKEEHNNLDQLVLPVKYDPDDTRWTLKYQEATPRLVKLLPQYDIFVDCDYLAYCLRESKDCKSLAIRLLQNVFNVEALSVCSTLKDRDSTNVGPNNRPPLDLDAVLAIFEFVLEHGLQRGWNIETQPIIDSIDNKIKDIRLKYGKYS